MIQKTKLNYLLLPLLILATLSCGVSKKVIREQQFLETNLDSLPIVKIDPLKLEIGDVVNISIYSQGINQEQVQPFLTGGNSNDRVTVAHQIDINGNITMPFLGIVKAKGLYPKQLSDTLTDKLKPHIKDPIVIARNNGIQIKVLGQVNKQGVFNYVGEYVTIFDAITSAAGITEFGHKDSVIVIREADGKRSILDVNLTTGKVFSNEGYRLKNNDIVVVKDNGKRLMLEQVSQKEKKFQFTFLIVNMLTVTLSLVLLLRNIL